MTVRDAGLDGIMGNADDATVARTFTVTVNTVNQSPTLDAIANPAAINENAGLQTVNLTGIGAGRATRNSCRSPPRATTRPCLPDPTVAYTSPNATGSLSYQPAAFAYGTAHATVTLRDAGLDGVMGNLDDATVTRTFTVMVNQVNQVPTLDAIADPAAIDENSGPQTVNLTGITAGTGDSQQLQVTATSDNTALIPNPTVAYTSPNATATLSYQPAAFEYGTAHVTATVRDAGLDGILGTADDGTFSQTFTVTVNAYQIANVVVAEATGPRDGILTVKDAIVVSWSMADRSGIASKSFLLDGNPVPTIYGPYDINYCVVVGPLNAGKHSFAIQVGGNSGQTSRYDGTIAVVDGQAESGPVISGVVIAENGTRDGILRADENLVCRGR